VAGGRYQDLPALPPERSAPFQARAKSEAFETTCHPDTSTGQDAFGLRKLRARLVQALGERCGQVGVIRYGEKSSGRC
jgi:hypothetical protein